MRPTDARRYGLNDFNKMLHLYLQKAERYFTSTGIRVY